MKKSLMIAALGAALAAPQALASFSVTVYHDTTSYSSGNGGEMRAQPSGGLEFVLQFYDSKAKDGTGTMFQTFCIERSEAFVPGTPYSVELSDSAKYNGNPPLGADKISRGTAYLYSLFATGNLTGYNYSYGPGRTASAAKLQEAIWILEGELNGTIDSQLQNILAAKFGGGLAEWSADVGPGEDFGVRVMNLGLPNQVQDMLVVVPEPSTYVAGTLALLPLAFGLRAVARRRAQPSM
jgi:hypothetical protein